VARGCKIINYSHEEEEEEEEEDTTFVAQRTWLHWTQNRMSNSHNFNCTEVNNRERDRLKD